MELNAKLSSLEDEVKLLKGEVKVILSEIRAAVLGQDNPFMTEPGQGLHGDPRALEDRPPIRVVKIPAEGQEEEPSIEFVQPQSEAAFLGDPVSTAEPEEVPDIPEPTAAQPPPQEEELPAAMPAARAAPPPTPPPPTAAAPTHQPTTISPQTAHEWSLLTVAGLAVWAEDAVKQIGPERLRILLDLCEFTGYLSTAAKEALLRVTSLAPAAEKTDKPPSVNDCLVVLYQLDALMRGEEPTGARRLAGLDR